MIRLTINLFILFPICKLLGIRGATVDALVQNTLAVISPSSPESFSLKLAQMISPYRDQKRLAQFSRSSLGGWLTNAMLKLSLFPSYLVENLIVRISRLSTSLPKC